ncbi:hypothetical protein [Pyxidicoccus xibeiensis]|uniref:hypothetical protein n=1 Tax=Pyxidicoccus xibeiensis TaxID=2906759 RepID=UPI0020A76A1A|nr:hypothetical protein [Pyxidicoccus xibeiensis]MCP3142332.1 hypothetical protein [Pyxidicoccus xibeiensis]
MGRSPRQSPVPKHWRGREDELQHLFADLSSELVVWADVEASFTPAPVPAREPEAPLPAMLPLPQPFTLLRLRN